MSAALKHNQESETLSRKPPLGENRPKLRLVWENPALSADAHREKSKANLEVVSGERFYAYVNNNPINFNDPSGKIIDTVADIAFIGYDLYSLYQNPGWDTAAALGLDVVGAIVPGVTGLGAGYRAGNGAIDATRAVHGINNPVPETLARVVPGDIPNPTRLGVTDDVFVTDASLLNGMRPSEIANGLEIPNANSFNIIEFPTSSVSSIATPIGRNNPGFTGGGLTSGGFPEFVIPNGPIPSGSTMSFVGNRTNGLGAAYNLSQDIGGLFGGEGAGGGFVLYPSRPNTNMMNSVYSK